MTASRSALVLASRSPRRIALLKEAGLAFEVLPAEVEECPVPGRTPQENAQAIARDKAEWTAKRRPGRFVLAADTLVALDGQIFGKPRDRQDAHAMLKRLSGHTHLVVTGLAAIGPQGACLMEAVTSTVTFKTLGPREIETYLATGEAMDKAGAYAIQGQGGALVASHHGSLSNIIGLPVEQAVALLQRLGF